MELTILNQPHIPDVNGAKVIIITYHLHTMMRCPKRCPYPIIFVSFNLTVARQVPPVGENRLPLPGRLSSSPDLQWDWCCFIFSQFLFVQLVPDLDKERPQAIPLVRPLTIPHVHDWRKMQVCLINFNVQSFKSALWKVSIFIWYKFYLKIFALKWYSRNYFSE